MKPFSSPYFMVCTVVSLTAAYPLASQAVTFARLWPHNRAQILDVKQNSWRTIYRSPAWSTTDISVGSRGDRIALLPWARGTVAGHGYVVSPASELIVIDTLGHVLAPAVAQVQRYAWCGSRCIVFLTGQYEESHYGFRPQGLGVLDLATRKTRLLPSPTTPIGISWAAFDSAAYLKNLPRIGEAYIYRLDLARGTLEPTELKDHLFSPTGRYYLFAGEFTDTLVVYETKTNSPVDIEAFRRGAIPLGWVSAREDLLLAVKRPPTSHGAYSATKAARPERGAALRALLGVRSSRKAGSTYGGGTSERVARIGEPAACRT